MSMYSFDFEASGLLEDPDLYYHCGLFKALNKNRFMLFLPLNDRTHYSEEDIEKAKNFILAKKTLYKDFEVRIADFSELEGWLTGNSDWSPTALNCHNCYSYDFMLMERLSGIHFDMFRDPKCMGTINDHQVNLFDTLAMSRILWPDRPLPKGCPDAVFNPVTKKMQPVGPHGLMAWGYALGNQKVQIDDWRELPLWKYVDRVFEDVIIQELLWKELVAESKGVFYGKSDMQNFMYDPAKEKPKGFKKITWKNALRRGMLQHFLMELQARQGVYFDIDGAIALRDRCDALMKEIADRVEPQLPLKELSMSQRPKFPEKPFNQDGTISNNGWKWLKDKLGYPVDMSALEFKAPPKRAFTSTGDVSKMGIKWCEEMGCKDPDKMADFLRGYIKGTSTPHPLPKELMDQAISDLQQKRMPDCKIPMKISNQDDIKRYLISAGWLPTMWRTKDVTKDSKKKALPDADVDARVYAYMDELLESEYCDLIINFWNKTDAKFQTTVHKFRSFPNSERVKKEVFGKIRRKARALITSPQLKDTFGHLCPNLEKLNGEMAKDIVLWLSLRNRRSVLDPIKEDKVDTGLLNHPRLKIDHKLPAKSSGLTNTSRQKHSICANMPKPSPKVVMGKEMRSLWGVPPGYFEIGIDGSNLEQLIGAWGAFEFDNGLYYDVVSNGDAHCYSGDTQILTEKGWIRFEDLDQETQVFQYDHNTSSMSLVTPLNYVKRSYCGDMYHFHNSSVDFMVTDQHRMLTVDHRSNKLFEDLAKDLKAGKGSNSGRRFIHAAEFYGNTTLSPAQINLLIAIHDDGNLHTNKDGSSVCRVQVGKGRKVATLLDTFSALNLDYTEQCGKTTKGGLLARRFQFHVPSWVFKFLDSNKDFTYSLMDLDKESKNLFIASLSNWDGWVSSEGGKVIYYSQAECRKKSVEVVSALATQCGLRNNTVTIHREGRAVQHRITIGSKQKAGLLTLDKDLVEVSNSLVYCVTVPSGAIIVRRNGKVAVCGNCNNAKAYSSVAGKEISRNDGKPVTYGVMYGAQKDKVADMLDISPELGQRVIDALWDANPGLKGRKEDLEKFWEATGKKFIYSFDGHAIWTRSKHSLLNAYQQNGGASLCDLVGILMHHQMVKRGWYDEGVRRIIYYHK